MTATLTIGTRGSQLALWQANWVKSTLESLHPAIDITITTIKTRGDKILDVALAKVGGKGLFVKEIETALQEHRIDLAVHSMKDMPAVIPDGLYIAAVPERETPEDVLISRRGLGLLDLPEGARVGTSSLRRSAQLLHTRPDITLLPLRGNLDTRLKKLKTENLDAIVLAAAGVKRLGLQEHITEFLDHTVMLPAVGQGALCIESRENDPIVGPLVASLDHEESHTAIRAERAFLHRLEGGCQVPMAGNATVRDGRVTMDGLVADVDGGTVIRKQVSGPVQQAHSLGVELAEALLEKGAGKILERLTAIEP